MIFAFQCSFSSGGIDISPVLTDVLMHILAPFIIRLPDWSRTTHPPPLLRLYQTPATPTLSAAVPVVSCRSPSRSSSGW